jgi:hypothetical protein
MKFLPILFIIFFLLQTTHCNTIDQPNYIEENKAREKLYLITILKCSQSGGSAKNFLEIFAFVEKNFSKTYTLSEEERKQITYYKKDVQTCERNITLFNFVNCNLKDFDLLNLALKGKLCKLEPAGFFQF